jgi:hypothetical protein
MWQRTNEYLEYESIPARSKFPLTLTQKRRCEKKNSICGTFCFEIPLQISFPGLQTDRRQEDIAVVRVDRKANTSASVPEEESYTRL